MKLGFIGCGNMASAIIKGILARETVSGSDISVYDILTENTANAARLFGIQPCSNTKELIQNSDIIILAVKPKDLASVLNKNVTVLSEKNPLIISIAAGKTLEYLAGNLTYKAKLVRVMPNINAKVSEAMSGYCCSDSVSDEEKALVERIFSSVGKIMEIDENYFPLYGVIAGCSPAFGYLFINAMAEAAVKFGMNKQTALEISAQTILGSAKMILESDEHPWALIDQVCSPGGTTIEGVLSLQKNGFETAIHKAIAKAVDKDSKI